MRWVIIIPNPVPGRREPPVAKGVNNTARSSGVMPVPLSETDMVTVSSDSVMRTRMETPSPACLAALVTTFVTACPISRGSTWRRSGAPWLSNRMDQAQIEQIGLQAGFGQEVGGHIDHLVGVLCDGLNEAFLVGVEWAGALIEEQLGSAAHDGQGRT